MFCVMVFFFFKQKTAYEMRISDWSSDVCSSDLPWAPAEQTLNSISMEVELGFDVQTALRETQRCLNCDVQTVFLRDRCIECDACVDICPMDCISFTGNADEPILRQQLVAPAQIGRASCRGSVCAYVSISVGAVRFK